MATNRIITIPFYFYEYYISEMEIITYSGKQKIQTLGALYLIIGVNAQLDLLLLAEINFNLCHL